MASAYDLAIEKGQVYVNENYMNVFDPVSKVQMSVLKDIGLTLISLGWESLSHSAHDGTDTNEEETYRDDSEYIGVTDHIIEVTTTAISTDILTEVVTEMSTDSATTDMMTEVIYDLVSTTVSSSTWDGLKNDGAQVASLIGENVTFIATNLTEGIKRINFTDEIRKAIMTEGGQEESPKIFKRFQDLFPAFLPGPLQVSLLLMCASAILLVTSKFSFTFN